MFGGFKSTTRLALLAVPGMWLLGTPAQAADLGGDCCADLEERVAELEATAARKGNRKVKLTISGWVNEAVFAWDDGTESNVYVGTNSLEQDRIKFSGEAKIDDKWSAGYTIELGINGAPSNQFSQNIDEGASSNMLSTRHAFWFVKNKDLGSVRVGLTGTATYHLLDDADGANTRNYSDAEAAAVAQAAFLFRVNGDLSSRKWSDALRGVPNNRTPGQNGRRNIVRYDSPEIHGFTFTASWGEDDMWGTALSYKDSWGDFKVIGKVGYENLTDENPTGQSCDTTAVVEQDCEWWGAAGTVMHVPTGLYVYGGFGHLDDPSRSKPADGGIAGADDTDEVWFVQAGIEKKFIEHGTTTIFGEYRHDDAGSNLAVFSDAALGFTDTYIHNSDLEFWAAGVVQNISAAAMDLYVIYRHAEGDVTSGTGITTDVDDFDMVISGARIQF